MNIGILTSIGSTVNAFFPPLIQRWQELGHEVFTAASTPSEHEEHTIVGSVSRKPSPRNLRAPEEIKAWAEKEKLDVIITNTATASFLARLRPLPVPVVYFCHGLHWNVGKDLKSRFWQTLERSALRNTAGVIVINHDDEQWFRSKLPAEMILRLPQGVGVPLDDFPRSPIPAVNGKIELVWAGEFSDRKRPWLAVEVIHSLVSKGISVHLTMCGEGEHMERTASLIDERGVADSVTMVGRSSQVAKYLAESQGMLLTSTWEGLPRIGLEALAIGRPVFAFDVKGTRSLPSVYSAPDGDVEQLAQLIADHSSTGFSDINLVDPAELSPDRAAEEIASFVDATASDRRR
ncbi:glycosyltransferase [Corynebacterium sp. S7]